jgi:hypothetical protein
MDLHICDDASVEEDLRVFVVLDGILLAFLEAYEKLLESTDEDGDGEVVCGESGRHLGSVEC